MFTSRASSRASASGSSILRSHNLEQKKTKEPNYYFQFDSFTTSLIKPTIKIFIQIAWLFFSKVSIQHCIANLFILLLELAFISAMLWGDNTSIDSTDTASGREGRKYSTYKNRSLYNSLESGNSPTYLKKIVITLLISYNTSAME